MRGNLSNSLEKANVCAVVSVKEQGNSKLWAWRGTRPLLTSIAPLYLTVVKLHALISYTCASFNSLYTIFTLIDSFKYLVLTNII